MTICRGGRTGRARCARITSGCVRRVRPGRRTAGADALVNFATGVMIFRVPSQASRVTIRLAASFGLALVWLFIPMCQHVSIPVIGKSVIFFH